MPEFKKNFSVVGCIILLGMAGCDSGDSGAASEIVAAIDGNTFVSTGVTVDGEDFTLTSPHAMEVTFGELSMLSATAGCNTMSGRYSINNGRLKVQNISTTLIGCEGLLQEQEYLLSKLLASSPFIVVDGDTVVLNGTVDEASIQINLLNQEMATPDYPLTETDWQLNALLIENGTEGADWNPAPSMMFNEDDTVTFFTGCNTGEANYVASETQITFSNATWTEAGCEFASRDELEQAVLAIITATSPITYEITRNQLDLRAGNTGLRLLAEQD